MIFGADYYPEHWPEDRWLKDAELMQKIGINAIRMGEFGWSVIERREGEYDFSLYDKAVSIFANYGIHTIMGTPTATPPAWLCTKYPDIFMTDRHGNVRGYGSRRHYCYNHMGYQAETKRIVEMIARHYRNNDHVIAWQVDNELGCEDDVLCYCDRCKAAFITWLKEKYKTLKNLNEAWGTVFWSQTYTEWEQIIVPKDTVVDGYTGDGHNPGLILDFKRFSSDSLCKYAELQTNVLREASDKIITHNIVSEQCDNYKLATLFDIIGYDAYPYSEWDHNSPGRSGFMYDLSRGYADKPLWILEQQSGPCGWNVLGETPHEGQLKLWSLQAAARGIEALVYFRWRTCPFGTEQYWYGILDHDGIPRKRYQEIGDAIRVIRDNERIFCLPEKKKVLLIYNYDNKFCHDEQPHVRGFVYKEEVERYYEALRRLHIPVRIGSIKETLEEYKILILPFVSMIEEEDSERIRNYVKNGGILILTPFSGLRRMNNQITTETLPGVFRDMSGVTVVSFHAMEKKKIFYEGFGNIQLWREELWLDSAQCFKEEWISPEGSALVSQNMYGCGQVFYISCCMESYDRVMSVILDEIGLAPVYGDIPDSVECIEKDNGNYLILLNHSTREKVFTLNGYKDNKKRLSSIQIEGYGFAVAVRE